MAISTMWIRNNMLFSSCEQYERQLTEAELKVQRSLKKLSIPDWYLNRRSDPKILNYVVPIESRPPSWKSCEFKKNSKFDLASPSLSDTLLCVESAVNIRNNRTDKGTYRVSKREKSTEAKSKNSSPKSSPSPSPSPSPSLLLSPMNEEVFDTTIPKIKLPTNISRTFPKMSPPRKIQNINIVFPPGPPINVSSEIRHDIVTKHSKHAALMSKKPSIDADEEKEETGEQGSFRSAETVSTMLSVRTSNVKGSFKVRATTIPKFTPANLFSSTVIEEEFPRAKKVLSQSILEKSFIFEGSSRSDSCAEKSFENAVKPKKLSQSLLEKTWIFEGGSKSEVLSGTKFETPRKEVDGRPNLLLERNVGSNDQILLEDGEDGKAAVSASMSASVREIVNGSEVSAGQIRGFEKNLYPNWKEEISVREKKSSFEKKSWAVQGRTSNSALILEERKTKFELQSPRTRFLYSRKKSKELENVMRSGQSAIRGNTVVQSIIETLKQKANKSSSSSPPPRRAAPSRRNNIIRISQNFVKKLIDVLEEGKVLEVEASTMTKKEEDTGSCSESEGESCKTTTSPRETDSNNDSDHRFTEFRSDENNRTVCAEGSKIRKSSEDEGKIGENDDSVYWIPVSRCKLPRTSSLLNMMSKLPANGHSACVSPIRRSNKAVAWG